MCMACALHAYTQVSCRPNLKPESVPEYLAVLRHVKRALGERRDATQMIVNDGWVHSAELLRQVRAWHARACTPCMYAHVHPADPCMCAELLRQAFAVGDPGPVVFVSDSDR